MKDGPSCPPYACLFTILACSWDHCTEIFSAATLLALYLLLEESQDVSCQTWSCTESGKISTTDLTHNITDLEEQFPGSRWTDDLTQGSFDPCQGLIKHLISLQLTVCSVETHWSQGFDVSFSWFTLHWAIISFSLGKHIGESLRGKGIHIQKLILSAGVVWAKWLVPINRNY